MLTRLCSRPTSGCYTIYGTYAAQPDPKTTMINYGKRAQHGWPASCTIRRRSPVLIGERRRSPRWRLDPMLMDRSRSSCGWSVAGAARHVTEGSSGRWRQEQHQHRDDCSSGERSAGTIAAARSSSSPADSAPATASEPDILSRVGETTPICDLGAVL